MVSRLSNRPLCSKSFTRHKTAMLLESKSRTRTGQTKEITILSNGPAKKQAEKQ